MKIAHPTYKQLLFEDVVEGDVFEARGSLYMKVAIPQNLNNAVDLYDGDAVHFNDTDPVLPVDCELVIK